MRSNSDIRLSFLAVETYGSATVARLTRSKLSEEDNIELLGRELLLLIEHFQCQQLALSLDLVEFITSAALGKLILIHRKLHRNQGKLVVCDVREGVAEILKNSRLDQYLNIADDTPGALRLLLAT